MTDEEWEGYCRKTVTTDNRWWEDWLAKMNKYIEEQHSQPPPPPKPKLTEAEQRKNIESFDITKCAGCGIKCDDEYLNNDLLCQECVKKGNDHPSFVVPGNPETAFFFQKFGYSPEIMICEAVCYLHCPTCNYNIKHLSDLRPQQPLYMILFDHFVKKHYILDKKEHNEFENLAYAILQEFTIFEANRKHTRDSKQSKIYHSRKALAVHNMMKHLGIPLNILATTLRRNQTDIGDYAFSGIELCHICNK